MIVQFGCIENAHEHLEEVKPNKAKESLREHYDMAQLSKELATINTDSPLEFSYEKAKVENPYTTEAYELCKRLEFKNMLNRFDPATAADSSMELEFFTCNDLSGMETLFEKAANKKQVGISVLADTDQVYTVGLVLDEKEIYQIPVGGLLTGDYLCGKIAALGEHTVICAMDIKTVLKHVALTEPTKVFDTGVAAYLLNPLKSSYTYDDIAREYLDGIMLPAKEDLLGKIPLKKAWRMRWKVWVIWPVIRLLCRIWYEKSFLRSWMKQVCERFMTRSSFRWYLHWIPWKNGGFLSGERN